VVHVAGLGEEPGEPEQDDGAMVTSVTYKIAVSDYEPVHPMNDTAMAGAHFEERALMDMGKAGPMHTVYKQLCEGDAEYKGFSSVEPPKRGGRLPNAGLESSLLPYMDT